MDVITQLWILGSNLMSVLGFLGAVLLLSRVRSRPSHPGTTLAWLMGMIFVPVIAVPLYLSFGGRVLRRRASRKRQLDLEESELPPQPTPRDRMQDELFNLKGTPPVLDGNRVEFLSEPQAVYTELLDRIREARESIEFETFIFSNDETGRALLRAMAERARDGVKVRLLVDGVGSFWLSSAAVRELREAGGEVARFLQVLPLRRRWAANHRLHRKIYLFDRRVALVGGHNIGAEYMGPEHDEKRWIDATFLLQGPAIEPLSAIFSADWRFATGESIKGAPTTPERVGDAIVQIVASGPDAEGDPFYDVLLTAMMQTRKRLWIVTPYFIPDDTILRMLCLLGRMGRDVRLIVPERSNHVLADLARRSALRQLADSNVAIHLTGPGMMHAKALVIDNAVASVGSTNMDMRSLYLNFEVAAFVYTEAEIMRVVGFVEWLCERSRGWERRPITRNVFVETAENMARLLSPLL